MEDEVIIANDLCRQLQERGYDPVASTRSGEEAIPLADRLRPDLVLMDVQLDGAIDGITAARVIRERFALPVVFLTAFCDRATLDRAKEAEPFGYLLKPFDERNLGPVIEMALVMHQMERRLSVSEAYSRAFAEAAHDAIIMMDETGAVTSWNPAATRMFGYTAAEMLGQDLLQLIVPERFRPAQAAALPRWQQTGEGAAMGQTVELFAVHRNGTEFPIELSLSGLQSGNQRFAVGIIRDITQRKQTERALIEHQTLLQTLVNNLPLRVYQKDAAGRKILTNPADMRYLGATTEAEVLGKTDADFFPPAAAAQTQAEEQALLQAGQPQLNREDKVLQADGSCHWFLNSKVPLYNAAGQATGLVGIGLDITARKRAEMQHAALLGLAEATHEAEDLPTLFRRIHEIVGELLPARNFYVALHEPGTDLLSFPYFVDELDPVPVPRPPGNGLTGLVLRTGQPLLLTAAMIETMHHAGQISLIGTSPLEWLGVPLISPERNIGVLAVQIYSGTRHLTSQDLQLLTFVSHQIADIIARKRTEQQMRLQSAALESVVNSVVITDTKGIIQWVNPAFCRITGFTAAEVIGQNPRVLRSGCQPPEYYAEMWRTVASGASWHGEFVNKRKDGTFYTEEVTITPVRDQTGEISHFIAIKQDITALKQSLQELQAAHAELGEKNRLLHDALIEARSAGEAKANFLATMSHEIRTPMNGVIGMASLLQETAPLTAEQADYIKIILSSGDTLLTLINDVLDFSKIESQHMVLEQVPFDLRECVEETLLTLGPLAREKQLDLIVAIDPAVPPAIVGDGVRLRQVITNLVGNAVKFTQKGSVVVEVKAEPMAGDRHRLYFRIQDTGIGIPPDKLDRLFKPFMQVDDSTTRIYGGTGLGLVISQRLVGFMGGTIEVDTEPGRGSVFFFDFTVREDVAIRPLDPGLLPQALVGRTVLIVDDIAANRRIFATQLQRAGCRTAEAVSGVEALVWLRGHAWPDLIITDMLMPGMDGLDFTINVRALETVKGRLSLVPVIMASSGGYQSNDPRAARAGLATVLFKPIRQKQFLETAAWACVSLPTPRPVSRPKSGPPDLQMIAPQHPRHILLVEDNAVNRKVALAILRLLGYDATIACDGVAAIEACRTGAFDLVFMDVQMPVLNGLDATRAIRQLPGPQPLIIAMTANAMPGDRENCVAAGMDDYLAKPINIADLQRALTATRQLGSPPLAHAQTLEPDAAG